VSDVKPFRYRDWDTAVEEALRPLQEFVDRLGGGPTAEDKLLLPKPPVDAAVARLIHHPSVVLIVGHRGSGKSALACRLQELKQDIAPPSSLCPLYQTA